MTFGDNGDVGFKMFTERDNWSVYYAMTDDATADDISLQLVTDTDAPQVYPGKLGYGKGVYDIEVNLNTMKMTLTSEKHRLLDRLFDDRRSHSGRLGQPHVPAQEGR